MTPDITVHGFETSNNIKVRIALGYKRLPFAFHAIDPADRTRIEELSGQHLTPVLTHGDRVVTDSGAIMRYLDMTFPDTPKLYGVGRDAQWAIEDWEMFARWELAGPLMRVIHARVQEAPIDDATVEACAQEFERATDKLAQRLEGREWLASDTMSAADITAAVVVYRAQSGGFLRLGASVDAITPWVDRVMAFDSHGN